MKLLSAWFLCFFILSCYTHLESSEPPQKIYISSADLEITDQGIYLYQVNKGYSLIDSVFFDDYGLYIIEIKSDKIIDTCFNGHRLWCLRCNGCALAWCKGRCKCVDWPCEIKP